jgi:DNA-binding ferritin-like protein
MSIEALAKQAALKSNVTLQPHQERVRQRLQAGDKRLLLYHGLGTGKSLSSLAAAEGADGNYAAVVPAALKPNYEKEIEKFTDSDPEVLTYTGVGMGKQPTNAAKTLIFDEAHRLRNPDTAGAQAATDLADQSENVLLLTGTPITNAPSDLASLVSILNKKPITPEAFTDQFVGYKHVYPSWLDRLLGTRAGEEGYVRNEAALRQLLKGKVDYQPGKAPEGVKIDEQTVRVPLSSAQSRIQKSIRSGIPPEWAWKLDKEFPLTRDELKSLNSFLTGLRQSSLSTQPFRADKDPYKAFQESGKLQRAMQDLKQELSSDPRKKGLIYSNYIDAGIAPYAAALEREGIPYGVYHGSVPAKQREAALRDYNEGKLRALLLGPAAAEGISTKGTNLIQLLDPHWHESRSNQARGRGLRFDSHVGLPADLKNVAVRRYVSESQEPSFIMRQLGKKRQRTGDEILEALAARKEALNDRFRQILQEEGSPMKSAADSEIKTTLQNLVFNSISLAQLFKHCHWNVRGTMFAPLHSFLDTVYDTLLEISDDLAERMQALDYPASGLVSDVAAQAAIATMPTKFLKPDTVVDELTVQLKQLTEMFNTAIKTTEADPVTSNLLQDQTKQLEKHLWMLRSQKKHADTAVKSAAMAALACLTEKQAVSLTPLVKGLSGLANKAKPLITSSVSNMANYSKPVATNLRQFSRKAPVVAAQSVKPVLRTTSNLAQSAKPVLRTTADKAVIPALKHLANRPKDLPYRPVVDTTKAILSPRIKGVSLNKVNLAGGLGLSGMGAANELAKSPDIFLPVDGNLASTQAKERYNSKLPSAILSTLAANAKYDAHPLDRQALYSLIKFLKNKLYGKVVGNLRNPKPLFNLPSTYITTPSTRQFGQLFTDPVPDKDLINQELAEFFRIAKTLPPGDLVKAPSTHIATNLAGQLIPRTKSEMLQTVKQLLPTAFNPSKLTK